MILLFPVSQWYDLASSRSYWSSMRYHLRDHLGFLCKQTAPWWRVSINRNPFSFTCRDDRFLEQRITNRIAWRARTSFLDAVGLSAVRNALLDLSSSLWSWISFTTRSVSLEITTWDVFSRLTIDGIATSIQYPSRIFHNVWTSKTGPKIVPSRIAAKTWDFGKDREHVHSRHKDCSSSPHGDARA